MATQTQELTVSIPTAPNSDSDFRIQPSGFITNRKKRRRSSSSRNRDHFKWTKAETVASDERGEPKFTLVAIIYWPYGIITDITTITFSHFIIMWWSHNILFYY